MDGRRIGRRVAAARAARGWNRSALARRAEIHPSYVSKLERGGYLRPSIDRIVRIAEALGIRVVDLTMDTAATVSSALHSELAPLGYQDDEVALVGDIVRQVAHYPVPTRQRVLSAILALVTIHPK
jgi:transcriptional regulator with XRE-family HTH domain